MNGENQITHSGFVTILGRPNVGKSTFLNNVIGEKIVITSPKPQTTRNRITGVVNRDGCQLVFFDTPGVHDSPRLINQYMNKQALETLREVEVALLMVDASVGVTAADRLLAQKLEGAPVPVILVVNKIDIAKAATTDFIGLAKFHEVHVISSVTGRGIDELIGQLISMMPEGPEYYPDDIMTDRPERFIAQEYIREKVFELTGEEIPYSVAVTVESWRDEVEKNLAVIHATIHVERKSQKGIIIGKHGAMIKQIGQLARQDLERLLGVRVFLDLHVGVEHNWTKDPRQLSRFGYEGS